jgi:hypothetical protein
MTPHKSGWLTRQIKSAVPVGAQEQPVRVVNTIFLREAESAD